MFESMSYVIAGLVGIALSLARIPPRLLRFCPLSHRWRRRFVQVASVGEAAAFGFGFSHTQRPCSLSFSLSLSLSLSLSVQFLFSTRTHISLSLSASAPFLFSACTHISLSLCICSVSVSARQRKQSLIQLNTDSVACVSNFTCK